MQGFEQYEGCFHFFHRIGPKLATLPLPPLADAGLLVAIFVVAAVLAGVAFLVAAALAEVAFLVAAVIAGLVLAVVAILLRLVPWLVRLEFVQL